MERQTMSEATKDRAERPEEQQSSMPVSQHNQSQGRQTQEREKVQQPPIKMYRTVDRLMVAAPMPGMEPEDIVVEVKPDGRLLLHGELRGLLKDIKELLVDEWSAGYYQREISLPNSVDGEHANVNYGNGVLVVTLPISQQNVPAVLTLAKTGAARGERVGNVGHQTR
jgi:HSP20 family protein